MEGAWKLLALLGLAQALSLSSRRRLLEVRLACGAIFGTALLAPYHGPLAAFIYTSFPLGTWTAAHLAISRTRIAWRATLVSEAIYMASVLFWLAVYDPPIRTQLVSWADEVADPTSIAVVATYIGAVFGGAHLVRLSLESFLSHIGDAQQLALPRAGRVIGWAERFVIITLVAGGYGEPVGWLLAAKTAVRYPEIKEERLAASPSTSSSAHF